MRQHKKIIPVFGINQTDISNHQALLMVVSIMTMKSNADDDDDKVDHAVDVDGGNGDDEVNRDDDQDRPPVSPTRLSSD